MTICIAAICEKGKNVVLAADRMYTSPPPINVEFESDEAKIELLNSGIVLLPAGNTAIVTEILDLARANLKGQTVTIALAGEALRSAYQQVRMQKSEETIVLPMLGRDFVIQRETTRVSIPDYLEAQPGIYQAIVATQSQQFNLGTDLMFAGIQASGARIGIITHPGSLFWLDKLGYGAVGSGAIHALSTMNLAGQTRSRTLSETLFAVYGAKKAAQVAPGVGPVTDLAVLEERGSLRKCEEPVLNELDKAWSKAKNSAPPDMKGVMSAYARPPP